MPEFHNAFLDSYFAAQQQQMERMRLMQSANQFQQRLNWEQSQHAQEFQQRAEQFKQEQAYKDAVFKNTQQQQSNELQRQHQEDFTRATDKGMYLMPTPQDQQVQLQIGRAS